MEKFEYTSETSIYYCDDSHSKHMKFLNEMGDKGWELASVIISEVRPGHTTITVTQYTTYWKRKIVKPHPGTVFGPM